MDNPTQSLCALCDDFTQIMIECVQAGSHVLPPLSTSPTDADRHCFTTAEWRDSMTIWQGVFKHHSSLSDLVASAATCRLCRLLESDFAHLAATTSPSSSPSPSPSPTTATTRDEYCRGWLGLYVKGQAAYTTISGGLPSPSDVFRAGFSHSLDRMPPRKAPHNNPPLMYRVCVPSDETHPPLRKPSIESRTARGIPEDGTASVVFDVANAWLAECVEKHAECRERPPTQAAGGAGGATSRSDGPLPTRVLDVYMEDPALGEDQVKLCLLGGKQAPYVALSHCWGGNIPNKTIKATLDALQRGIPVASLPQNFQDAVLITRQLHLRYLWIDALCIVQDDPADWAREADLMDEVYAYSTVTITGLNAPSSTAGILRPRRPASVVLPKTPEYAIQACADSLPIALGNSVLSERAWCLQERFLAPRLLHWGAAQVLWECRAALAAEDDRPWDWQGSGLAVRNLVNLHRAMGQVTTTTTTTATATATAPPTGEQWCMLVEEYSRRRLTVGTDKLPAMMGTSQLFRARSPPLGAYVAGLWRGDLARGLCWGPSLALHEDRKRPGYASHDVLAPWTRPDPARAPSWSWASVDGPLYFPCARRFQTPWVSEIEVLDIQLDRNKNKGGGAGTLTLRGRVGVFTYEVPPPPAQEGLPQGDVGLLVQRQPAHPKEEDGIHVHVPAGCCVLDLDRHRARTTGCHALLVASANMPRALACFLVLDKRADGTFRRIGVATSFSPPQGREAFQRMVDGLDMQQLSIQ